jgi:nicotinate dehydrogenase subunit A
MSTSVNLQVNGIFHNVIVDYHDTPLLYVLRDDLRLKGTRFGCGNGQCGACTVLVDGRAAKSCELPAWSLEGKAILTIEGLGNPEHLHPLQQAIVDFQAAQCGYCLPGIIMSAAELIQSNTPVSRAALAEKLKPSLCRCGTHTRILAALESAWRRLRQPLGRDR